MIKTILRSLGALGCLVTACMAAFLAWMGAGASTDERERIAELTGYSQALLGQIELDRKDPRISREALERSALKTLQRAPLLDAPLALIGLLASESGDRDRADEAFRRTFSRSPRNVLALAWLADRAIAGGRVEEAIQFLSNLFNVAPEQGEIYANAMAALARAPGGLAAIERRLQQDGSPPPWASSVVSSVNAIWPDPEQLESLNRITPTTQERFIARVIAERDIVTGFRVWRRLLPEGSDQPISWPYDNHFQRRPGAPPFNWRFHGSLVEPSSAGGLYVSYMGRGRQLVVEQTMLLTAGRYELAVQMSSDLRADGGGFSWSIACIPTEAVLGQVVIRAEPAIATTAGFIFDVSETGCQAQKLSLHGEPGEFTLPGRLSIKSVDINPVGRGT